MSGVPSSRRVDGVQADVAFVGGIIEWHKIAHLAAAFGRKVAPLYDSLFSSYVESKIATCSRTWSAVVLPNSACSKSQLPKDGIGIPSHRPGRSHR
ncbi:enolase C-terminal domain-like protein [Candidatus Phyllobacterium onerii]|uniref:enolase C-terminal domain-like protein n=1 Tax=Candidatus Phyllobacterium onerii TaxID=3020828 RepID=UPI003A85294F